MIAKKYLLLLVILPIFILSLTTINVPAPFPAPYVKVYVLQPLGYLPFVDPGTPPAIVPVQIYIETSGFTDNGADSIIGWGMDVQVDPNILAPFNAMTGSTTFLYQFVDYGWTWYTWFYEYPTFLSGAKDPVTGFWDEITEIIMGSPVGGAGDGFNGKMVTLLFNSKNNTQGCLIDLIDVEWLDPDNVWHAVDVVVDGYYGGPPPIQPGYPSAIGSGPTTIDLTNPIGTTWHELYPNYCNILTLTSWEDNGDGKLSASDQIDLVNETDGWTYWYHVDAVTTTIHWTFKPDGTTPDPALTGDAEPNEDHLITNVMTNPIGSYWHQIYPDYSRRFKITSWIDNGAPGFDPSDQFDFVYEDEPGVTYYAHLDAVSTDLIWSFKSKEEIPIPEFPLGLGLIMAIAPAIPIVYLWRTRKKVTAK